MVVIPSTGHNFTEEIVEASVQRINRMTNSDHLNKLVKVIKIKNQFLPPIGYRHFIDFQVAHSTCLKSEIIQDLNKCEFLNDGSITTCHTAIMNRFLIGQKLSIYSAYCDKKN